ncbi:MAG TPA: MFS transporter [Clostridiales bacterium]|nr:MFS transporter [Clostridiales bacterium]
MKIDRSGSNSRSFRVFLAGQGFLGLAESVRFIAVTILIHDITGSGISAATGTALSALPGILASPFAGVIGDRSGERGLLVLIDVLRSLAVLLFLFAGNITQIYLLIILISVSDVFYNPSRRKYVLRLTGKKGALKANSLLTGAGGAAWLAGPLFAGFLADRYGPAPSILLSSVCCLITALFTIFSATEGEIGRYAVKKQYHRESALSALTDGIRYCRTSASIRELLAADLVIGFCIISVNLAFYPFAFDILKVTAKGWGMMITAYYGANLIAMFLAEQMDGRTDKGGGRIFYACLASAALIWLLYAVSKAYAVVLLLQFAEGTIIAVSGIILAARCQTAADREYMARVAAFSDMMAGIGKLAGMSAASFIIRKCSFIGVFAFCGVLMFIFAIKGSTGSVWGRGRKPSCTAGQ